MPMHLPLLILAAALGATSAPCPDGLVTVDTKAVGCADLLWPPM